MKATTNISFRQLSVVLGLVVSLFILSTANYQLTSIKKVADQSENSQEAPQIDVKSFDLLNSSAQIELDHQLFVVRELEEDTEDEIQNDFKHFVQNQFGRAFKILFQRIIAPNAP